MLSNITVIQGQWKRISAAGEDGVARINRYLGSRMPNVIIAHTDSVQPQPDDIPLVIAVDLSVDAAYLMPYNKISDPLYSDNAADIYYATVLAVGESVELVVDFA